MRIVFKYTSRSRPEKFRRGAESILRNMSAENQAVFLVTIDSDDCTMSEQFVRSCFSGVPESHLVVDVGISQNKIHAINRGLEKLHLLEPWDILVNMSDDMVFLKPGFDVVLSKHCGSDTFLHVPDGHQNQALATMSIMGKTYYERFGYIYHPVYISVYCDMEAQDVAKKLGCYKYVNERIFEHLHPTWGLAEMDAQYRRTETKELYSKDGASYHNRKAAGFPADRVAHLPPPVSSTVFVSGGPLTISILVPTVPSRSSKLDRLMKNIRENSGDKQEGKDYEICVLCTPASSNGGPQTGTKRNQLVESARGEYVWFVDDDDLLMNNSLSLVIDLCRSEKRDIVSICGKFTVDGLGDAKWSIRKGNRNRDVLDKATGIQHLHRAPNHITPTRREISLGCKFPDVSFAEDAVYCQRLRGRVRSESILEIPAYHYDYSSRDKLYDSSPAVKTSRKR